MRRIAAAGGVWDGIWRDDQVGERDRWTFLAELVFRELVRVRAPGVSAELGAGSGKLNARFFAPGQPVIHLDRSRESYAWLAAQRPGWTVAGDVRALPFRAGALGWCWHSGVLEHFPTDEQRLILAEMRRVIRPGGRGTVIVPFRSLLFRTGQAILRKVDRWPFGYEEPLTTLAPLLPPGTVLETESIFGFFELFSGLFKTLRWRRLYRFLDGALLGMWASPLGGAAAAVDRLAARFFGGYLLISSFQVAPRP